MHMADTLVSPLVGGTMWAASAGLIGWSARRLHSVVDDRRVPLMGVLGAFVFAAQMINFAIPGTGSSGHLGGGLLLAILLGPPAALLVITSVLTVQALFFADGGLLALGCNIFNLGFFPAFVAYPLLYRPLAKGDQAGWRFWLGTVLAAVLALQLGALAVVSQTVASHISSLPPGRFLLLMQPVHLAIGLVEGVATAAVAAFVLRARPELRTIVPTATAGHRPSGVLALLLMAVLTGGVLSWFASSRPDGLEWALENSGDGAELAVPNTAIHDTLATLQDKTALLPDYALPTGQSATANPDPQHTTAAPWPAPAVDTSLAGLLGGALTLALAAALGWSWRQRQTPARRS